MLTLSSPAETQRLTSQWRKEGEVALVPTMGALHAGHMALVARAKQLAPKVVLSLFVNPLQFGPNEDFHRYPRPFDADRALCEAGGVDLIFHPQVTELYPSGFQTTVKAGALAEPLEGASRPGHFDGVGTVCLKLFQISQASVALFGEKDFQQLRIIQQMVTDLNLPCAIVPHPIVRESDGLALSSRNRYLSAEERAWAARIPQAWQAARDSARANAAASVGEVLATARSVLTSAPLQIDYLVIASSSDLRPVGLDRPLADVVSPRLLLAVKAGTTRLIDNVALFDG